MERHRRPPRSTFESQPLNPAGRRVSISSLKIVVREEKLKRRQATIARYRKAARITRCTAPWSTVVRPVPSVITDAIRPDCPEMASPTGFNGPTSRLPIGAGESLTFGPTVAGSANGQSSMQTLCSRAAAQGTYRRKLVLASFPPAAAQFR
jgi:hypothetical protein